MKKLFIFMGLILMVSTSTIAASGPGGGDSVTSRMRDLQLYFENNGQVTKYLLKTFLKELVKFQAAGESSKLLMELHDKGLNEDIDNTIYDVQAKCVDKKGEEKSASTETGVRNSTICINLHKLGSENAQPGEIVGLLMHEHVRHFGYDDTTPLELHPTAIFVSDRMGHLNIASTAYLALSKEQRKEGIWLWTDWRKLKWNDENELPKAQSVLKDVSIYDVYHYRFSGRDYQDRFEIFSTRPDRVHIVIDKIVGKCKGEVMQGKRYTTKLSPVDFREGTKISAKSEFFLTRVGWGKRSKCLVTLAIENDFGRVTLEPLEILTQISFLVRAVDLTDNQPAYQPTSVY